MTYIVKYTYRIHVLTYNDSSHIQAHLQINHRNIKTRWYWHTTFTMKTLPPRTTINTHHIYKTSRQRKHAKKFFSCRFSGYFNVFFFSVLIISLCMSNHNTSLIWTQWVRSFDQSFNRQYQRSICCYWDDAILSF